jgi:hypothetical protein
MDNISSRYEIPRTAEFLRGRAYTRVALQVIFPLLLLSAKIFFFFDFELYRCV